MIRSGDVEHEGWFYAISLMGIDKLRAHLVSHHGSEHSFCDRLWEYHSARGKPIAVVTSYVSQNLPRKLALDEAGRYCQAVLITWGTAIRATELPEGLSPEQLKVRLALGEKMGVVRDESSHACGRWTFVIDDCGRCIRREPLDPAVPLSFSSKSRFQLRSSDTSGARSAS